MNDVTLILMRNNEITGICATSSTIEYTLLTKNGQYIIIMYIYKINVHVYRQQMW
jgi:hypothetical protein